MDDQNKDTGKVKGKTDDVDIPPMDDVPTEDIEVEKELIDGFDLGTLICKFAPFLDINKDGKITKDDLDLNNDGDTNWKDLGWILVGLSSIMINLFIEYIGKSIESSSWKPDGILSISGYILGAVFILYYSKKKFELTDQELKDLLSKIDRLKGKVSDEKIKIRELRNKYERKISEMKITNRMKIAQKDSIIQSKSDFIDLIWPFLQNDIKEKIQRIQD